MKVSDFGKSYIFLPDATQGSVKYVDSRSLWEIGTKGVVVNTLHLAFNLGLERMHRLGGIHKLMDWNGIVLSDSGGFQVFSLIHRKAWHGKISDEGAEFKHPNTGQKIYLTPEFSLDMQMAIGSDICVVLDDCRDANISRHEAEESVERTIKWAYRSKKYWDKKYAQKGKLLSAVVQGAQFLDLREYCAKELTKIGFDGYNFGGFVVDDGNLVEDELRLVAQNTPEDKFRYGMGIGKPLDIVKAASLGYKVFDTVLVTRNARHGTLYVGDREDSIKINIRNEQFAEDFSPIDTTCDCFACTHFSKAYVRHLLRQKEGVGYMLASIHNLRFYQRLTNSLNGMDGGLLVKKILLLNAS